MKVVILAGGLGTRLSEYTKKIPKPMVEIGGIPIIRHIINLFINAGFSDFIIAGGYKYEVIKKYFQKNKIHNSIIRVVNTGKNSLTAKRLYNLKKFVNNQRFLLTYGDGLCDVPIQELVKFHIRNKKILTITAVHPPARFGELIIKGNKLENFQEKPQLQKGWINGGFFVVEPEFYKYISKKNQMLEREPISKIIKSSMASAYKHSGFWYCMDNIRDKEILESMYKKKTKIWEQLKQKNT